MTIRFQLALLFMVLVSLILTGFAVFAYVRMSIEAEQDFDAILTSRAITASVIVLEEDKLDSVKYNIVKREFDVSQLPEERIVVMDFHNTILFRNDVGEPRFFSSVPSALEAVQKVGSLHFTQEIADKEYRTLYQRYHDNNQEFVIIVSAVDKRGMETLRDMRRILGYGILGVLLFSFGAGWLFARRMLAPVDVMTRLAEEISAFDLHKRIPEADKNDEISRLAHAFNGMFDRLERAFTAQRHFIAHASHELRTPLTASEGELEVALMNESLPDGAKFALVETLDNTRQLRTMVNDLLLLARAESGVSAISQENIEFAEIVFEALDHVQKRFAGRTVHINFENFVGGDEAPIHIRCNAELMRVAVQNILENALKYSSNETSVMVSIGSGIAQGRYYARLSVEDFGIGIAEEEQERVFEPFVRSERTYDIPGTGIGLALVKTIIAQHDGTISLKSAPNAGTIVTIMLPHIQGSI